MAQVGRQSMEYTFQVLASARISVAESDGRRARELVERALGGSTARLGSGPGAGLDLVDVRVAGPVTLTSIDGIDPVAALEAALRRYDASGGGR